MLNPEQIPIFNAGPRTQHIPRLLSELMDNYHSCIQKQNHNIFKNQIKTKEELISTIILKKKKLKRNRVITHNFWKK